MYTDPIFSDGFGVKCQLSAGQQRAQWRHLTGFFLHTQLIYDVQSKKKKSAESDLVQYIPIVKLDL